MAAYHEQKRSGLINLNLDPSQTFYIEKTIGAYSSAGEHFVDIEGVTGSIPVTPTKKKCCFFVNYLQKIKFGEKYENKKLIEIIETTTQKLPSSKETRQSLCDKQSATQV